MDGAATVVGDVMTRRVVALRTGATFKDIVKTIREWRVSALPVLDDAGRVVGVVSEADMLPKEEYRRSDLDRYGRLQHPADVYKAGAVTAGELMTGPAVTVTPDATLARAARIMARHGVKRLPVVGHDGVLKGIVSREVVEPLFGTHAEALRVEVRDGVVTLSGLVHDTALVPLAALLVRGVEGVVDVQCALTGPASHPDPVPDLPDTRRTSAST
jgi:CBS-domain-containing membrane protein